MGRQCIDEPFLLVHGLVPHSITVQPSLICTQNNKVLGFSVDVRRLVVLHLDTLLLRWHGSMPRDRGRAVFSRRSKRPAETRDFDACSFGLLGFHSEFGALHLCDFRSYFHADSSDSARGGDSGCRAKASQKSPRRIATDCVLVIRKAAKTGVRDTCYYT